MHQTYTLCVCFCLYQCYYCARRRAPIIRQSLDNLSKAAHKKGGPSSAVLLSIVAIFLAAVLFFLLLQVSGDIELNPGSLKHTSCLISCYSYEIIHIHVSLSIQSRLHDCSSGPPTANESSDEGRDHVDAPCEIMDDTSDDDESPSAKYAVAFPCCHLPATVRFLRLLSKNTKHCKFQLAQRQANGHLRCSESKGA